MKKIVFCILSMTTFVLSAQQEHTISGYVKESSNGEALFGVNIIVDGDKGTTTNDYGFFSISLIEGTHNVVVSYLGFETMQQEVVLDADKKLSFQMVEESNTLDEVVVTTSKTTRDIKSTEMSVATLKTATIKKLPTGLGEVDVLKSIQLLPGVSSVSEGSSGFNVRGGSSDQNLVLLDDATIFNASHLLGFFSVFNADAVKDVKLYKGGIPATFGGRLSSVLDIKQREGNLKEFEGELGIGLISSRALIQGPIGKGNKEEGKGSYLLAGRRSYIDVFAPLIDDFKDTKLFFYDLNLKVNYNLNENNRLYLSGYFGQDQFAIKNIFGNTYGNGSATLRYTSVLNDKLFFQSSLIYSDYNYEVDVLTSGSEFRWASSIVNWNLKPRLNWYISSGNTLKAGVDFTYYNFNPGEISSINNSTTTPQEFQEKYALETAPYVDFEQKISDKLSLQYGLRWSYFQRLGNETVPTYLNGAPLTFNTTLDLFYENAVASETNYAKGDIIESFNNFEPRASARFLWNENTSLKASYNRNYQYLHLISNSTSATPLDIWAPSGPYLKPQYSNQFALGYFRTLKDNNYDFSVEAYYKDLSDVTDFVDGADLLFQEQIETQVVQGDGRAYGMEFQLNKNSGKLTGWLSYTLARTERKIQGINNNKFYPANNDQLHEVSLVGLYKLNDRWDFGANFVYGSGKPVTYPTGKFEQNGLIVADYEGRNGNRLPAFHRLDLSATLNPKEGRNGTWIFSLANVYNRQNAATIFFRERVDEINNIDIPTGQTEASKFSFLGIVPSVTYQFKF
ncbi:TonB-dependent receptor [Zobellia nedashkovskayae]|uniref:TonB-dependent receptor n=1 Tax=Zobellia nedashkovskayae TaxID=2779510 RepID=UPI00188AD7C8|nr:TonB-dependent receptor [Zobellia nedashkovskayae]